MRAPLQVVLGLMVVVLGGAIFCAAPARAEGPPLAPVSPEQEPPPAGYTAQGEPQPPLVIDPKLPLSALLQSAGAAFSATRYDECIAYLNVAYAQKAAPMLLFNIAQAHRKAGHTQKALELYERYLRENPSSPLAPEAAAHGEAMRARLAAEQATVARGEAEQLARERAEQAEQAARLHAAERLQAEAALRKEIARKELPVYKRKWFWGLLGGLVATGVVAGVVVGLALQPPPEPVGTLSTQDVRF